MLFIYFYRYSYHGQASHCSPLMLLIFWLLSFVLWGTSSELPAQSWESWQ